MSNQALGLEIFSFILGCRVVDVIAEPDFKQSGFMAKIIGVYAAFLKRLFESNGIIKIGKRAYLNGISHFLKCVAANGWQVTVDAFAKTACPLTQLVIPCVMCTGGHWQDHQATRKA
jgi:hypothetical protein